MSRACHKLYFFSGPHNPQNNMWRQRSVILCCCLLCHECFKLIFCILFSICCRRFDWFDSQNYVSINVRLRIFIRSEYGLLNKSSTCLRLCNELLKTNWFSMYEFYKSLVISWKPPNVNLCKEHEFLFTSLNTSLIYCCK